MFKFLAFLNGDLYILESAYSSSLGELQEEPHAVSIDHSLEIIGKYASLTLGIESYRIVDNSGVFLSAQFILVLVSTIALSLRVICASKQPSSCCDSCT